MVETSVTADAAQAYLSAGLCALPAIRAEKRPAVGRWKEYQTRLPTTGEMSVWMANNPDAVCILCGQASDNAEILDFDAGGELFDAWCEKVRALSPGLLERLVVERTPSGGWHVIYLCLAAICGNLKLAQRKVGDTLVTLIETRGEGGLFLCAPTEGYEITQGDLCDLPVLSEDERNILLQAAWELNEHWPPVFDGPRESGPVGQRGRISGGQGGCASYSAGGGPISADLSDMWPDPSNNAHRPGDDFNHRGDVREILQQHGWAAITDRQGRDGNEYWRRPGKTSGWSATLKDRVFYVFSSNAGPFDPNQGYSPFGVYSQLEHGGDFQQAARSLRTMGYGSDSLPDSDGDVDISAIVGSCGAGASDHADSLPEIRCLEDLLEEFDGLHRPIVHGLLREGETMNIIAAPKMGKSWLTISLAACIASGLDWMGLAVEQGRVLHIDNELHPSLLQSRYKTVSEAMGLPPRLFGGNIDMVSLRGQLRDLVSLGSLFAKIESGRYKLVIIDAFYRTLPIGTDENDNGAVANLYNRIDHYAGQMQCAFVLIHHTSKGNQAGKAVTDVGAGAGSQSRAADTHLVLRPHEQDGIVVLESAVRSWPPLPAKALHWQWPLFTPTGEVDPTALRGANKPKAKAKEVTMEVFIEQCIAAFDPCSKASVRYEARQRFDLPDRQIDEMLDLAIDRELVSRIRVGSRMKYVVNRPGVTGEKGLLTAAILARKPDAVAQEIADEVGASKRYVNMIRKSMDLEVGNEGPQ